MAKRRIPNEIRFMEKVRVLPCGCWEWTGWRDKDGYGMFNFRLEDDTLKDIRATHASLAIFKQVSLPLAEQACHTCDYSSCVNPEHIFEGSQQDNMTDMVSKSRHMHGNETYNAVLTEEIVLAMREKRKGGMSVSAIAQHFGFKRSTTGAAITGQNWKHI